MLKLTKNCGCKVSQFGVFHARLYMGCRNIYRNDENHDLLDPDREFIVIYCNAWRHQDMVLSKQAIHTLGEPGRKS